ncbi:LysR family transcriptional regulator, partial [Pseudoalteromonas sp. S1727]
DQVITLQPKLAVQNYINNRHLVHKLPHLIPKTIGINGIYRSRKNQSIALREFIHN